MKTNKTIEIGHLNFCKVPKECTCNRKYWVEIFNEQLALSKKKYQEELLAEIEKKKYACGALAEMPSDWWHHNNGLDKAIALIKTGGEE